MELEEVCRRYDMSVEEFLAWERAIERHGVPGLRVTRLQIYRDGDAGAPKTRQRNRPGRDPGSGQANGPRRGEGNGQANGRDRRR